MSTQITCVICNTVNPLSARFCQHCGGRLEAIQETVLVPDAGAQPSQQMLNRKAYFGAKTKLAFYLRDFRQTVVCDFNESFTVGREATNLGNHIDLSKYNAAALGVSRQHVRFLRQGSTMMVEDLGTKNGTYLNGEKLPEKRPEVVSHGDELRLAKMALTIVFRQE